MSARVFSLAAFRQPQSVERRSPVRDLAFEARRARNIADNFYPTPPEATRALLSVESFDGPIWEPACGEGHIAKVLVAAGYDVVSTDLNDRGFGEVDVDFLSARAPRAKDIVTNPPYGNGLADAFVEKALGFCRETGGVVAMLLNLDSLCSRSRTRWWRTHPPARIYAIDGVLCWPEPDRAPPRHFTENRYVWVVWTPGFQGRPEFWWLSAAAFREPAAGEPRTNLVSLDWLRQMKS